MNRSIAFAATSLSAILLVASLATSASADGPKIARNIKLDQFRAKTFDPGVQDQAADQQATNTPSSETPVQVEEFVKQFEPAVKEQADNQNPLDNNDKPVASLKNFEPDVGAPELPNDQADDLPNQQASSESPIVPKAFTFNDKDEAGAPQIEDTTGSVDDIAEDAPPPPKKVKKLPKVLQIADGIDDPAPPKKIIKPKAPVDAATSDDIDEEEDFSTKKEVKKPVVDTAETDDEEDATPTYNGKFRMRYSPALRRYVQVTDEDLAYEAAEYQEDDSYEAPVYRQSYVHGYGHRYSHRYSNSYLPSCEN